MKKIGILIFSICVLGLSTSQAQLKLGLKLGANFNSLSGVDVSELASASTGWHAGGMVEIKIAMIGIQGDLLYSQTGAFLDMSALDPTLTSGDLKNTYFDIPIVVKLYLLKILTIQAGGQFSNLTGMSFEGNDLKDVYADQINNNLFQPILGVGVEVGPIHGSLRYVWPGGSSFNDLDIKNSKIQLAVGFWLKK